MKTKKLVKRLRKLLNKYSDYSPSCGEDERTVAKAIDVILKLKKSNKSLKKQLKVLSDEYAALEEEHLRLIRELEYH